MAHRVPSHAGCTSPGSVTSAVEQVYLAVPPNPDPLGKSFRWRIEGRASTAPSPAAIASPGAAAATDITYSHPLL
jgi:hypothetical protein